MGAVRGQDEAVDRVESNSLLLQRRWLRVDGDDVGGRVCRDVINDDIHFARKSALWGFWYCLRRSSK